MIFIPSMLMELFEAIEALKQFSLPNSLGTPFNLFEINSFDMPRCLSLFPMPSVYQYCGQGRSKLCNSSCGGMDSQLYTDISRILPRNSDLMRKLANNTHFSLATVSVSLQCVVPLNILSFSDVMSQYFGNFWKGNPLGREKKPGRETPRRQNPIHVQSSHLIDALQSTWQSTQSC